MLKIPKAVDKLLSISVSDYFFRMHSLLSSNAFSTHMRFLSVKPVGVILV